MTVGASPSLDLRVGEFPEVLSDVADGSVSLIIADPPWNDLEAWDNVAAFGARVLRDAGTLVAYIGNRWSFEALDLLSHRLLRVRLAYLPVMHQAPFDETVACHEVGSFMAILAKGRFVPRKSWSSAVGPSGPEQLWHPFQRPLENVRHYVEAFTDPGDLVVDPFLGSGTSAVACAVSGRTFIGSDIASAFVDMAGRRLRALGATETDPAPPDQRSR